MIANGETEPLRETELRVREKLDAFARTGSDKLADVSNAAILGNFRAAIRANEICQRRMSSHREVEVPYFNIAPKAGLRTAAGAAGPQV
jgi:hypothetical protein